MWVWYLDRAAGLVAFALIWLAALSGVFYSARDLGALHRVSRAVHVPATVMSIIGLLLHVVSGVADAAFVWLGRVPHPAYTDAYFAVGLYVGVIALVVLVTATLAFLDPRRFERPWDPRLVHMFAYGGFAFATIHAVAIGTDVPALVRPGLVAATGLILAALVVRAWAQVRAGRVSEAARGS